ncbi:MAG: hypothetical protein JSS34_05970 [Proteobacteria bacterium]|nr:hypothetical protein [Pseudomonadota bacterium]
MMFSLYDGLNNEPHLIPIEVKSSQTISSSFFEGLLYWKNLAKEEKGYLIYAGEKEESRSNFSLLPWNKVEVIE